MVSWGWGIIFKDEGGEGCLIAVDETAQRILPNTQDKDNSDTDKGMDGLKLIVSFHYVCDHFKNY